MSQWIQHPALWEEAQKRAAKETPRWTAAFWRKVKELYISIGGGFKEDEETEFSDE